ncbi:MAG: hypothetical protein L0H93_18515 [Nocardioides sp.]|nr:hypothetical protein [Nocardioides sp.]
MTALPTLSDDYRAIVHSRFDDRTPDVIESQIRAVLEFLHIASNADGMFIPLTRAADDVWHELIVETKYYFDLCSRLPGGSYMHHHAIGIEDYAAQLGKRETVQQFLSWIPLRVRLFGEFTADDKANWAVLEFLEDEVGLSLEQINELGKTHAAS